MWVKTIGFAALTVFNPKEAKIGGGRLNVVSSDGKMELSFDLHDLPVLFEKVLALPTEAPTLPDHAIGFPPKKGKAA